MSRTKGALGKNKQPVELALSEEERLNLLADLILEVVSEELGESSMEKADVF